ncbi:unnamed protein product [Timema podura]|uniref:AB hydrolase-1 domain-containing protein n=1 Tax=Timema podura TaxID=61482 RepID=A0ABN7NTG8_TIMPD|nr:unnamed protein product [Timema podura]
MLKLLPQLLLKGRKDILLRALSQVPLSQPLAKDVQEIRIPVPWGHIAGKWWGRTDVQPVLGLHGWEENANTFDTLVPLLNLESFLVIDLIGHGMSSHLPHGRLYNYMDFIAMVRFIQRYYKWNKFSILGHSLGSSIGFIYAGLYPDAVEKYVSIDCARTLIMTTLDSELDMIRHTIDSTLALENKLGKNPPFYEFEELVHRVYEGSLHSPTIESCRIILKRGTSEVNKEGKSGYFLSRDPRIRSQWLGKLSKDVYIACASAITCEVLSIRGKQGHLYGGEVEEVYLQTLELMNKSALIFEHHEVEGTHHLHLNNPERLSHPGPRPATPLVVTTHSKWWGPMDVKPILCLHGWQDNAGTWDTLAPLLTPGISLLAVDFPGHGLSSPYPRGQPYHQIEYIAFVRRIVNHYKWDKVSLMGHSMGSIISFMYSCTFSDDVNNFIGIDAFKPYSIAPAKLLGTWSSTLDKTLDTMNWHSRNTPTYSYKEMIDLWCKGTKNSVTRDSCEILMKRGAVSKLNDGRYSFTRDSLTKHTLGTGWTHELHLEFASNIKCNILIVRAKQGIMYEKIEYEKQALDIIKNTAGKFEHCEVEGVHHVHLNNPERVAPLIINFLKGNTI